MWRHSHLVHLAYCRRPGGTGPKTGIPPRFTPQQAEDSFCRRIVQQVLFRALS
jgi:hypothetical protein